MAFVLLERLLRDLELSLEAFAVCGVASGWRLRLEGTSWVTVHFVLAGHGRLRLAGGASVALQPRCLVLVPARRAHSLEIGPSIEHERRLSGAQASEGGLVVFEAGPFGQQELEVACGRLGAIVRSGQDLFERLDEPVLLDFSDSSEMVAIFDRLLEEQRHPGATTEAMMTALMNEVLVLIFRRLCDDPACPLPWLTALEDPRLSAALTLMLEHPERSHSVETLADAALMSRTAFASAFRQAFGLGPMAYLRQVRLRRAARLLRDSEMTVEQIAARVGYASRSQFSRAFADEYALAPVEFRHGARAE